MKPTKFYSTKKISLLFILLFSILAFSCSKEKNDTLDEEGSQNEENLPNVNEPPTDVSGVIIYKVGVSKNAELFIVNADGTGKVQLTQNDAEDADADFNPETSEIVYVNGDKYDGGVFIWKVNADGSNKVQLTSDGFESFNPVWKPDGSKILFSTNYYIAVMDSDGSNLTKVYDIGFPNQDAASKGYGAIWSPDGTQIFFQLEEDEVKNLYRMNTDGSNITKITNLTSESVSIENYSFNPDGTKISFYRFYDHSKHAIYTINADGTDLNQIIGIDEGNMGSLSNHPKDDKILFMGKIHSSGNPHPQIANFDGSNVNDFIPGSVKTPGTPVWSPTGNYVAFSSGGAFSGNEKNKAIGLIKPDGSGLFMLESTSTDNPITHIKWYKKN